MELARNPEMQSKARAEVNYIYNEIEQNGRNIAFSDIPRFKYVTKCICETLRMWNVAATVFPRVTTFDDTIVGKDGSDVELPKGTKFSFWYYGRTSRPLRVRCYEICRPKMAPEELPIIRPRFTSAGHFRNTM